MPHDAEAREKGTGTTYQEVLEGHGIRAKIAPRLGVEEGISAARTIFSQCWFDEKRRKAGLRALQFYKREWKDRQGQFVTPSTIGGVTEPMPSDTSPSRAGRIPTSSAAASSCHRSRSCIQRGLSRCAGKRDDFRMNRAVAAGAADDSASEDCFQLL